jgi:hypothetical protein
MVPSEITKEEKKKYEELKKISRFNPRKILDTVDIL